MAEKKGLACGSPQRLNGNRKSTVEDNMKHQLATLPLPLGRMILAMMACVLIFSPARAKRVELPPSAFDVVNRNFDNFVAQYLTLKPQIGELITVRLTAQPALLAEGETIAIDISVLAKNEPNPSLEIYPRYLETKMAQKETLKLVWKKGALRGEKALYHAAIKYSPKAAGNYVIHWKCDSGGDVPEFWRYFAVIDNSYAVMSIQSTTHGNQGPEPVLHELHLPYNYWHMPILFREGWGAEQWAAESRKSRQYGDTPSLMIWVSNGLYVQPAPDFDAKVSGWQVPFDRETPQVQKLVLRRYRKDVWPLLGLDGPIDNFHTYGIGNTSISAARSFGYKTIGSLCASQNWKDDTFQINHSGMPDRPYFIAKDDFRKSGDGGPNGLVGVQQCHRHPAICNDYACIYSFEPGVLVYPGKAFISDLKDFDENYFSNTSDFFEAMLQNRLSQKTPYFFTAGVEFGGSTPGTAEANEYFLRLAARKAAELPLAFATGDAISEYYRRHFTKTPETTCYLPDIFCGTQINGKPPLYPDILEIENGQLKALLRRPELLPYNQYDYTTAWKFPDWGNEGIPRKPHGYLVPDTDDRFRLTPTMIDTRLFQAARQDEEKQAATVVTLTLQAQAARKNLALAVWDIPREWNAGQEWYETSANCRFVPVRAPFTGNLNGVLVADVKPGANTFTLTVKTPRRTPGRTDVALNGGGIKGQVFSRDGQSTAYLFAADKTSQTLRLAVPDGRAVRLYNEASGGKGVVCKPGLNEFVLAPDTWVRVAGLKHEEIIAAPANK